VRLAALVLLILLGWLAPPAAAQVDLDALAARVQARLSDQSTATADLEALRAELAQARATALAVEQEKAPAIAELRARLETLGPAPAEGETEAPEVARLRAALTAEITAAQAPVLVAQEAAQRAEAQINEVDRIIRARIDADRFGHSPSPLLLTTWKSAASEIGGHITRRIAARKAEIADPQARTALFRSVPLILVLITTGIMAAFTLRRQINDWIERRLDKAANPRSILLLMLLRGLNRLVLPTVGAVLFFAALDIAGFGLPEELRGVGGLPASVLVLIGAGWVAGNFFAPQMAAQRFAPLDAQAARSGSHLTMLGGVLLSVHYALGDLATVWDLSPATQSVLGFPVVLLWSPLLWWTSRLVDVIASTATDSVPTAAGDDAGGRIGWRLLWTLARGLRIIAVAAPVLAAAGYVTGAGFVVAAAVLTLGLIAAAAVIQFAVSGIVVSLVSTDGSDGGLIPVMVGFVVILGCLPLLALIWGARVTDISDAWDLLARGVTIGGITVSLDVVVKFLLSFAIVVLVTRLLQSVLVGTVLPRTRLDVGAREAARAGVGYVGFALAVLAGIVGAGLDLSNLAIVAGALSVGIGFGLQTIVSNFVSGIILLVERPIKPGDWIEVGEFSGYVRGIRVRSTEIETFDRATVIIPNSDLIAGTVLNRTHIGMAGRLIVPVGVAYDSDPREVERILLEIADQHPVVLDDPPPAVVFASMGDSALNFELRCRLRDVNFTLTVRSDMNFTIFERFHAAGIVFPFPQREVRIVGYAHGDKPGDKPA
jgi:small-conductance mechanosensitive channel